MPELESGPRLSFCFDATESDLKNRELVAVLILQTQRQVKLQLQQALIWID